jgi:hypothetical protein
MRANPVVVKVGDKPSTLIAIAIEGCKRGGWRWGVIMSMAATLAAASITDRGKALTVGVGLRRG